ncbi:MAG: type II toxin-antitoxin system RelE/ParE family toxin [Dermatophilaceae bacterium]
MTPRSRPRRSSSPGGGQRPSEHPPERDFLWWSSAEGERSRAEEEFRQLPDYIQGSLVDVIGRYLRGQARRNDTDHLGKGIKEWRVRYGNNHFRILFFDWAHIAVGLTAFYKNQQRTPTRDINRAQQRRDAWVRTRGGSPPA